MLPPLIKTSSPIKTPTRGSIYGRRVTHSAIAPTLLLIASTLDTTIAATTSARTGPIRVYLVITISTRINIVYKWVTNIAKDV